MAKDQCGIDSTSETDQQEIANNGTAAHQKGAAHESTSEETQTGGRRRGTARNRRSKQAAEAEVAEHRREE
ncbi:MAG: hypothetical protein PVSMB1_04270 [Gemmatimonadaceae bacterium]